MSLRSKYLVVLIGVALTCGCNESEYSRLVKSELSKGIIANKLFLDFEFGDSQKLFFAKGWKINRTGKIKQGPGNQSVEWLLMDTDSAKSPIRFLFYPQFTEDDRLHIMDISFSYLGWSPWTKQLMTDQLIVAVMDTLMSWYGGNPFLMVENETIPNLIWVKVDGNRQISLFIRDEQIVEGKMEDLSIKYKDKF